uniref:Uncharacterized protein n=1 Tax=Mesocestoides corti TaxID=53468 RepID=A0A5K3EV44_MESCO
MSLLKLQKERSFAGCEKQKIKYRKICVRVMQNLFVYNLLDERKNYIATHTIVFSRQRTACASKSKKTLNYNNANI